MAYSLSGPNSVRFCQRTKSSKLGIFSCHNASEATQLDIRGRKKRVCRNCAELLLKHDKKARIIFDGEQPCKPL